MRRCLSFAVAVTFAFGLSPGALADALDDKFKPLISEQYAGEFMKKALQGIHYLNCDGLPCRETDEFELFNPPLSLDDTRQVMVIAIKGALAKWCELDEGRGTMALKSYQEERGFNARQAALSTAIHGTFLRMQKAVYDTSGTTCEEEIKAELDAALPKGLK